MRTVAETVDRLLGSKGDLGLLLAAPPEPGRKAGCLVAYRRGKPVAVAKFAQGDRRQASRIGKEQEYLGALWRAVPFPTVGVIPRALGSGKYGTEGRVALQSAARGVSLMRWLQARPRRLERVLELGLGWLCRFQRWQHGLEGEERRQAPAPVEAATAALGALAAAGVHLRGETTRRVAECYRGLGLGAPQHGDFWPGNLRWAGGRKLWVLDWEGYGQTKQPLYDAFHYCTSAGLAVGGMRWGSRDPGPLVRLYFEPGSQSRLLAAGVRRVADLVGVSGSLYPHLVAYLTRSAVRSLEFAREDGSVPYLADWVAMLEAVMDQERMVADGNRNP